MRQHGERWTEAEIGALRDLHPDHTAREIATLLGRTVDAVRYQAAMQGLHKLETERHRQASTTLADEIAAAKREWATTRPYRGGWP